MHMYIYVYMCKYVYRYIYRSIDLLIILPIVPDSNAGQRCPAATNSPLWITPRCSGIRASLD